jgi:hypothetical protein
MRDTQVFSKGCATWNWLLICIDNMFCQMPGIVCAKRYITTLCHFSSDISSLKWIYYDGWSEWRLNLLVYFLKQYAKSSIWVIHMVLSTLVHFSGYSWEEHRTSMKSYHKIPFFANYLNSTLHWSSCGGALSTVTLLVIFLLLRLLANEQVKGLLLCITFRLPWGSTKSISSS